jgi:hypothetical protein
MHGAFITVDGKKMSKSLNNIFTLADIKNKNIDQIVCLTNWHKGIFQQQYPEFNISVINNGIEPNLFKEQFVKHRNSFVYTSCSYRGLKRLLELWNEICKVLPDATLSISSYLEFPQDNDDDRWMDQFIRSRAEITHFGKLNRTELYKLMETSEYWLYPCSFCETSCITALEMLASEVICLYYPLAGLTDTLGEYGIQVSHGNEIDCLLNVTEKEKLTMKSRGKEYALSCSWKNRAIEWKNIFYEQVFYYENSFNIIPIKDYLNNLGKNILITNDKTKLHGNVTVIYKSDSITNNNFNLLNTEPLNISVRLNNILSNYKKYNTIYDYLVLSPTIIIITIITKVS